MDAPKVQITVAFEEYRFWMQYTASNTVNSSVAERLHVHLIIRESKLRGAKTFISGIGQVVREILKVQIRAGRSKYFSIVVQKKGQVYKYKLQRRNIMCPLSKEVLDIRPKIPGMRSLAQFWSLLEPKIVDSR